MERLQAECIALFRTRIGQKTDNLNFTDLVRDCLARSGSEQAGLLVSRLSVHRNRLRQVFCALFYAELSQSKFHVYFDAQSPKPHEVVDNFAASRAVVKESGLEHHLFCVETNAFVCA